MCIRYLDGQIHNIETAFIEEIKINTTEEEANQVTIRLKSENEEYWINSIKVTEHNLSTLWSIYDNNEEVEIVIVDHGYYKVVKLLGLYVAVTEKENNVFNDLNLSKHIKI